jgi:death on curing protein
VTEDPIEYLDLEDLLSMTRARGAGPVRDVGLLDAAVARPRSSAFGEDAYPTLELKAASLLHSIVRNRALVDGNERLAFLAAVVFLDLNGAYPALSDDEAFDLVIDAATGAADTEAIAERLVVRPSDTAT